MYIHAGATIIRTIIITRMRTRRILFKLLSVSTVLLPRRGVLRGVCFWDFYSSAVVSFSQCHSWHHPWKCSQRHVAPPPQPHTATKAAWLGRFEWLCCASFDFMLRLFFFSPHREIFFSVSEALWAKNVKILPKERTCTAAEHRVMTAEPDWGVTRCDEVWKGWGAPSRPRLWGNYRAEVGVGVRGWSPSCEEGLLGWRKQLIYWYRWWDWCHCQWRCYSCWGTRAGWSTCPSSGWNRRPCRRWAGCWGWSRLS